MKITHFIRIKNLNKYKYIGVFANNCYEFILMVLTGIMSYDFGLFPIYSTLFREKELLSILERTSLSVLCVNQSTIEILNQIFKNQQNTNTLKLLILFNNKEFNTESIKQRSDYDALCSNVELVDFSDFLTCETNEIVINELKGELNLLCLSSMNYRICYFTDRALLSTTEDLNDLDFFNFDELDIYYMINSLGDITEIIFLIKLALSGSKIAFCSDISNFFKEVEILHPTLLNTYSAIWKKIFNLIHNVISSLSKEKQQMIKNTIEMKMNEKDANVNESHCIWDKILFDKIRLKFGSKVRYMFSNNNTLNQSISKFLEISLKSKMINIFGTTETCGFISVNDKLDSSIGKILSTRKIEIGQCEKIGIYNKFNQNKNLNYIEETYGELIVHSDYIFYGYFENNIYTNVNAPFHTGDYFLMGVKDNNERDYIFIDKIENFLYIENKKYFSPLRFETSNYETFEGLVDNIFLSQNISNREFVLVLHNSNQQRKEREKLLLKIKDKINSNIRMPKHYFILEHNNRVFSSKFKIKRILLLEEVTKHFKSN